MALFKPLKGTRASLDSQPLHDGYAYFCTDDGSFHIDYIDADGNLQRKQLNAKDAETLMGKSLIELQSDWSVNDPVDPAYVQNRTHWMSVDRVTWFNNETMTFEAFNGAYNTQIVIDEPILDVGHTYTFVIDNTTFESEAYEFEGMVCLGNLSILDSSLTNTNELFLACSPLRDGVGGADGNFIMIATSLEGTSHTIAISADVTTYHKIDEKYLPQLIGRAGERVGSEIFNDYENNFAGGAYAHAEGHSTWASGYASHAEGEGTQATFENAHAEGCETIASGSNSHAEGNKTTASNYNAHAEGNTTIASGHSSHAEGVRTEASGQGAHAEGQNTKASAWHSHAAGQGTEAAGRSQYVFGEYNIVDDTASGVSQRGTYIHIVGNGNSVNAKSNAHTLDWSGNAWFAGDVKVGGTGQDDVNAKTLATTDDISWNNLKDRPFYSDDNVTIYESTITTSDLDGMYGFIDQSDVAKTAPALIEGETYTVTFDNDVYTCVCIYGTYLGNLSLLQYGENTNEPFAVVAQEGVAMCIATADTVSATHTIKIEGSVVKTLDAKYLPELPYVTMQEGNQYWVSKSDFAQTNSNLTYKGKSYTTNHEHFMHFLTAEGIWQINLVAYDTAQIPSASSFRMNYASSDGTLSFYWSSASNTTEITTVMHAYLYDVNTGNIIRRELDVQSVTIGAYTKKSHNIDFYINKSNPQDAKIIRSFDDYVEVYSQSEVDALIADIPKPDMSDYYTKSEIDSLELITVTDIDTICGGTIQSAEDVMF